MSVAKPFVFALMGDVHGPEEVLDFVGVNATGRRSTPCRRSRSTPTAGPTRWSTPARSPPRAWRRAATPRRSGNFIRDGLSRFAGRQLALDDEIFASASATNAVNRAIGDLLRSWGRLAGRSRRDRRPLHAAELPQCDRRDLAVMAATLAGGGVNPLTGEQRRRPGQLPVRVGRDGHGRPLRDVRRVAAAGRAARQEWDRRRHRDGVARQGRARARSPRDSTPPATASRANSSPPSFRAASGWICSSRHPSQGADDGHRPHRLDPRGHPLRRPTR